MSKTTRSTALVMINTLISRILGFVRSAVLAGYFGTTWVADVLNGAFNIPNTFRKLMAEGALSSAFIPFLAKEDVKDPSGESGKKLIQKLLGFQILLLVPLALILTIFSFPVINLIIKLAEPERQALASTVFKFFIWYLPLVSISAILMAALNTKGKFFIPSITPIVFSISVISSLVVFNKIMGPYSMVLGVLAGGLCQILFLIPTFLKQGYTIAPVFDMRDPVLKQIIRKWLPIMATSGIFAINQTIAIFLASRLGEGNVSSFNYGIVFWQLPYGLFSNAILTVFYPKMSKEIAAQEHRKAKKTLIKGVGDMFTFLFPASLFLIIGGLPIIAVSIQSGEFSFTSSLLTYRVLIYLSAGLFFVAVYNLLIRYYYAKGQFKVPLASAILVLMLDVGLSIVWMQTSLGVGGLALANSVSFTFGFFFLLFGIIKSEKELKFAKLFKEILKIIMASALPMVALYYLVRWSRPIWAAGRSFSSFSLVAGYSLGIVILSIVFFMMFRVKLVKELFNRRVNA